MDCSPLGSLVHEDSPGKNTGVDCHALLQGIFPTQGWKPGLPHCRQILYHLSHQGWEFPGSSVVRMQGCFQCRGHRFNRWLGTSSSSAIPSSVFNHQAYYSISTTLGKILVTFLLPNSIDACQFLPYFTSFLHLSCFYFYFHKAIFSFLCSHLSHIIRLRAPFYSFT